MTEVKITVDRATATAKMSGTLTSGMVGVKVDFSYSDIWNGLNKTAVFTAGKITRDVLNADGTVEVPPEVLQKPGEKLYVGVYGTNGDGTLIIPTVRAYVGSIIQGSDPSGDESTRPELPVWAQHEVRIKKLEDEGVGGNGKPGFSPTVSVEEIEGGNRITITDVNGENIVDVMDGKDGTPGADGKDGVIALTGATVGQIAKITAVDEAGVPTMWEPVDMPSGGDDEWVEILNTVTEAETAEVLFEAGEGKAIKKLRIYIETNVAGLSKASQITLRATNNLLDSNNSLMVKTPNTVNTWGYPVFIVESGKDTFPVALCTNGAVNGNSVANVVMGGIGQNNSTVPTKNPGPWRRFRIAPDGATFNAGVKIYAWGVYA